MCTVLKYSISELTEIGSDIDAILSQNIIDSLMEIKNNNKFIKRTSALRLEYTIDTTTSTQWRNEKQDEIISEEGLFDGTINSNLNKITNSNFDKISKIIIDTIITYKDRNEYMVRLLDMIFDKSINHPTYTNIYSKLCVQIIDIVGESFKDDIILKVNTFYKDTIIKNFEFNQNDVTYDEMCKINKEKFQLTGSFIFIGSLYMNDLITKDNVLEYYTTLLGTIQKEDDKEISHKYIECLSKLVTTIGDKLYREIGDTFDTIILDEINLLSTDKKKYKSKSRFMLQDILDLKKL